MQVSTFEGAVITLQKFYVQATIKFIVVLLKKAI